MGPRTPGLPGSLVVSSVVRLVLATATIAATIASARPASGESRSYVGGSFELTLAGVKCGLVHATEAGAGATTTLHVAAAEITPAIAGLAGAYLDAKAPPKDLSLSSSAVVHKSSEAKITSLRLPGVGTGAPPELVFVLETSPLKTSPFLKVGSDGAKPPTAKIAGFRIALGDLPTKRASRIDPITVRSKDGASSPSDVAFDISSADAPAFTGWAKSNATKTAREMTIEYLSPADEAILRVRLDRCTPSSVKPDGPTTHVVVTCSRAHRG